MAGGMARAIWGLPVILLAERDTVFPTPERDQRFQDRTTGDQYRYTGTQWVLDYRAANGETPISLKSYGAVGNGSADDSTAFEEAAAAAIAAGHYVVRMPPGRYITTREITLGSAVSFLGIGGRVPGGINNSASGYPIVLKNHAGNGFNWTGSAGLTLAAGGGMKDVRIVQVYGTPGSGMGSGIKLTATDSSHKPSWMQFENVTIEEMYGVAAPWAWAINIDGGSTNILDLYFTHCSTHTSGAAANEGAMRLDGASQPMIDTCTFYNTGAVVSVGDTNTSSSCQFMNCQALALKLDRSTATTWIGGILTTITDTANTTSDNLILPGRWSGSFTPAGGGAVGIYRYSSTKVVGGATGGFDFLRPIQIPNSRYFAGVTTAGTGSKALIGLDVNDAVRIDPTGAAINAVGAVPNFTDMTTGDLVTQDKIKATRFIPRTATITYSTSMTPAMSGGEAQTITATDGVAFTINAPSGAINGQTFELTIKNTSGGALGAITWNAIYKMSAWTSPATANSRSIRFRYDGTNWVEKARTPADVPN